MIHTCLGRGVVFIRLWRSQFIPLAGNGASPPAGSAPSRHYLSAQGLFDFTVSGCTPDSVLNFTITYPQALPPGTQYWKYGPTPGGGANSIPTLGESAMMALMLLLGLAGARRIRGTQNLAHRQPNPQDYFSQT
jgi:hypothetical protein